MVQKLNNHTFLTNLVNNVRLVVDDTSLHVIVDKDRIHAANTLTSDLDQLSVQWVIDFNPKKKTCKGYFTRKNISHSNVKFSKSGPKIE